MMRQHETSMKQLGDKLDTNLGQMSAKIETALRGTFRLTVRSDLPWAYPRAETPGHLITMGMHPSLDICAEMALRDMIGWIVDLTGLSREDAYMLCSLAGDLRVTQTVNGNKGVHMMMAKELVGQA